MAAPLWTPLPERVAGTAMAGLIQRLGHDDYRGLHHFSVTEPGAFWSRMWDECGLVGDNGDRTIDIGPTMRATRFFPDAQVSIVEHVLRWADDAHGLRDEPAIIAVAESDTGSGAGPTTGPGAGDGSVAGARTITWGALAVEVGAMAAALAAEGVREGDRVVLWLPNGIEAVVVMLGAVALGAVVSSTSPDFGAAGVLDRFGQIEPTVLFAVDGYDYGGTHHDRRAVRDEIVAGLPTLRRTVVLGDDYDAFLAPHRGTPAPIVRRPFDHPWYVLFSSGTTGVPKCIVHATGRVLLNHAKEHRFHCDLAPGDRLAYVTTCGWMMWNWLTSALASGVTIVCVDGNVMHPGPSRLWDLVDDHAVTMLGVGAKYLDAVAHLDYRPADRHDLSSLSTLASTGSPLTAERFAWVYGTVAADVHLASISGGTDLCGCFVLGDPTSPVYAGEIQRPGLGMAVDVWDADGRSVAPEGDGAEGDGPASEGPDGGGRGELVCTQPFPSQPLGFWGDDDGSRYRAAYYERYAPGRDVWHHGDFASWTEHEGMVIHGRSDTTLNPGGVRIGTAEIYRVVDEIRGITESLVFGRYIGDDVTITLLVVLDDGAALDDEMRKQITRRVRAQCSPRHVPRLVVAVDELPRTRSGKLVELAVGDVVNGRDVRNTEALANPDALWAIRDHPELQTP